MKFKVDCLSTRKAFDNGPGKGLGDGWEPRACMEKKHIEHSMKQTIFLIQKYLKIKMESNILQYDTLYNNIFHFNKRFKAQSYINT